MEALCTTLAPAPAPSKDAHHLSSTHSLSTCLFSFQILPNPLSIRPNMPRLIPISERPIRFLEDAWPFLSEDELEKAHEVEGAADLHIGRHMSHNGSATHVRMNTTPIGPSMTPYYIATLWFKQDDGTWVCELLTSRLRRTKRQALSGLKREVDKMSRRFQEIYALNRANCAALGLSEDVYDAQISIDAHRRRHWAGWFLTAGVVATRFDTGEQVIDFGTVRMTRGLLALVRRLKKHVEKVAEDLSEEFGA